MSDTVKYGMVGWDEVEFYTKKKGDKKKDEFLRFKEGENIVRLITKPYQYLVHKWKENENDKGYGDKIKCSIAHGSCPLCEKGDIPEQRWYIGAIDRKTQTFKIMDITKSIFRGIRNLNDNERWGDPGHYDICIVKDSEAGSNGYYTVQPLPKEPLSENDVKIKQSVDVEALLERCQPPKPEDVIRYMGYIRQKKNGGGSVQTVESMQKTSELEVQSTSEEVYDFPPAKIS